jgi:hypothetical protein
MVIAASGTTFALIAAEKNVPLVIAHKHIINDSGPVSALNGRAVKRGVALR